MAGLGSIAAQVALVAELRCRLFRNILRTPQGQLEMAARTLTAVLAGIGALGIGFALGAATFAALETGRLWLLTSAMWAVFGCWLLVPVLLAGMGMEFDFRNLLHFPLRFSSFTALSLLYGLLDPPSVVAIFWTACIAAGVGLARPQLLPMAGLILLLFTITNLLLNRIFLSWLARMLARRRTREALLAGFLLTIVGVQLLGALAGRWKDTLGPWMRAAAPFVVLLPPGAAGSAVAGSARNELPAMAAGSATLLAYGMAAGLLLRRRLRAQYLGEETGEDAAAKEGKEPITAGWRLPGLSNTVTAMSEKELRYAMRNGQTWMSLVMPLVMVVFFSLLESRPKGRTESPMPTAGGELFFPGAVAYGLLILAPLLHNTFAFEGRGIQFLLVAPVRFQEVLLAKNLVHAALVLATAMMTWALISMLGAPPGPALLAMTFSALLLVTLAHLMIGNALSLYFPRQIEFGSMRKRASQLNALVGFLCQLVLLGGVYAVAFQVRAAVGPGWAWMATAVYLALSAAGVWAYRRALDWGARTVLQQREKLLTEFSR